MCIAERREIKKIFSRDNLQQAVFEVIPKLLS